MKKLNWIIWICVQVVKWSCNLVGLYWGQPWRKEDYIQQLTYLAMVLQFLYYLNAFVNKSDFNSFVLIDSFYWKHLAFSCPLDFSTYLRASFLCIVPVSWGDGVRTSPTWPGPSTHLQLLLAGRVSRSWRNGPELELSCVPGVWKGSAALGFHLLWSSAPRLSETA